MIWSLLFGALPGLAKQGLSYLQSKNDTELAKMGLSRDVATSVVASETTRAVSALDAFKAMLSHPVFWIAWGLGALPVMAYHAAVFWVSIFPFWGWVVLEVPAAQAKFAETVVGNVFLLTGASSVVAGVAHAWATKK